MSTAESNPPAIVDTILNAIGNTPVVKLRKVIAPGSADVLVKLEYYNPTGSYKDRMALAMIEGAEGRGDLKAGMEVVEYTGGSTGSSLALVCAVKGYRFTPISSDGFAREKLETMRAFGADLQVVKSDGGKLTPDLFQRMKAEAEARAQDDNTFYTSQFHNDDAIKGYMNIGRELVVQTGGKIDVYCGGVGTAGMLMGVSRAFKEAGCAARIIALEPASSPVLTEGRAGAHRVEGICAGFVPPHLDRDYYDEARDVDEAEGRLMARRLAREEGIFTGTSSGLNVAAALKLAAELGPGHTVATVAVDTGLKYLAGDLFAG
jgi:cysteine synthase A